MNYAIPRNDLAEFSVHVSNDTYDWRILDKGSFSTEDCNIPWNYDGDNGNCTETHHEMWLLTGLPELKQTFRYVKLVKGVFMVPAVQSLRLLGENTRYGGSDIQGVSFSLSTYIVLKTQL